MGKVWVDTHIQPIKIWVKYGLAKWVKLLTFIHPKFMISLKKNCNFSSFLCSSSLIEKVKSLALQKYIF
uniref:Putative ovule protein n=1 Tax=Solanum chacoense TaxID=4108 RepID=A0A0V0HDT7_SOLCH